MYKLILILFTAASMHLQAQFYYYPFPPGKNEYKKNEVAGIKICYEYKMDNGEKYLTSILEYGSMGLPVVWYEKGVSDEGDSLTFSETTYKYNQNQGIELMTTDDYEEDMRFNTLFTYDARGRLMKKELTGIDPPTYTYNYDKKGRIEKAIITIKLPTYDEDGEPTGKSFNKPQTRLEFKYDTKNRLIEEWIFSLQEQEDTTTPMSKTKWKYNDKGQIIKVIDLDAEGKVHFEQEMEYNAKGLLSKVIKKTYDNEREEYVYEYCTDCVPSWMK
jgi:hypothetical protein